jgi:uracil-DNA glycosylase
MRDGGRAENLLKESSSLLKEELSILQPKYVVFVGHHPEDFFEDFQELRDLRREMGFRTTRVTHYAAIRKAEDLAPYYRSYQNLCPSEK